MRRQAGLQHHLLQVGLAMSFIHAMNRATNECDNSQQHTAANRYQWDHFFRNRIHHGPFFHLRQPADFACYRRILGDFRQDNEINGKTSESRLNSTEISDWLPIPLLAGLERSTSAGRNFARPRSKKTLLVVPQVRSLPIPFRRVPWGIPGIPHG